MKTADYDQLMAMARSTFLGVRRRHPGSESDMAALLVAAASDGTVLQTCPHAEYLAIVAVFAAIGFAFLQKSTDELEAAEAAQ